MPRKRKAGKSKASRRRPKGSRGAKKSGFTKTADRARGGTEDVEDTVMQWEYTVSSGISASAETIFGIKGNGIYRPGGIATVGLGQTTSPAGYARMYSQYTLAHVRSSRIELTAWATSGTISGGVPTGYSMNVPLKVACIPVQAAQAATYAALNVATLCDLAHATSAFGNNTIHVRNRGNDGLLLTALGRDSGAETVAGDYSAATGGDPAAPWYYMIGIANTSSALNATNYEVRIRVTYNVRWYQPIAQAVQFALRDRFGNEQSSEPTHAREGKKAPAMPAGTDSLSLCFSGDVGPESDDPDEILFRKMLASRLGTVPTKLSTSIGGAGAASLQPLRSALRREEPPVENKKA